MEKSHKAELPKTHDRPEVARKEEREQPDVGFVLPNPDMPKHLPLPPIKPVPNLAEGKIDLATPEGGIMVNTAARDLAIGGGLWVILFMVFLFIRNAYSNRLVSRRVTPSAADSAGRWLVVLLTSLSGVLIVAVVSLELIKFIGPPLALLAALAWYFTLLNSKR